MPRFPRWWFRAAVLVPAVITAGGLVIQTAGIERSVEAEARGAAPSATVVVDGRDVSLKGVPVEQAAEVKRAVEAARGVRDVSVVDPRMPLMRLAFTPAEVTVTGSTEQPAWREQFVRALGERTHGRALVDQTTTVVGTDFPMTRSAAEAVVGLLTQLQDKVTVEVVPGAVTITGAIPDDNRRRAVIALFKRLFGEKAVADKTTTKE
nr:BON domain-containing protein [Kibdelosporangium sp. MJ126-NF4]CEL21453.1 hypothetical protein [Kibdelosporangium sp. MJ126-NF4]CTQ95980.1 hypothetical protein [Kibdelosporangium sp. MJ126-NF4]